MPEPNGNAFRSAGFGGFKKKDVVAYIQEQTRKYTKQISTLEKSLDEALSEKKALQTDLETTREALEDMTQQIAGLRTEAEEIPSLKNALAQVEAENQTLKEELARIREETGDIPTLRAKLEGEKAALVQMEMEARLRADMVESAARTRADMLASRYSKEVSDAIGVFRHFKANADTTLLSASEQLKSILALFSEMERELTASGKVFEELTSQSSDPQQ